MKALTFEHVQKLLAERADAKAKRDAEDAKCKADWQAYHDYYDHKTQKVSTHNHKDTVLSPCVECGGEIKLGDKYQIVQRVGAAPWDNAQPIFQKYYVHVTCPDGGKQ